MDYAQAQGSDNLSRHRCLNVDLWSSVGRQIICDDIKRCDLLSTFCLWFSRWVEKGKSDKRQDFLLRVSSMQPNLGWNQYFTFLLWGSEICYEPGKKLIIVTYHCIGKEYIWLFWHSIWVARPTKKKMTTQWENLSTGFCFCSSAALQQALAVKSTEWSGILWASTSNIHQLWIAWSDEPAFISSTGLIMIYDRGWNPMRPHPSLPRWLATPDSVVQEHLWKPDIQVSAYCIYMLCEEYTVFSIAWS